MNVLGFYVSLRWYHKNINSYVLHYKHSATYRPNFYHLLSQKKYHSMIHNEALPRSLTSLLLCLCLNVLPPPLLPPIHSPSSLCHCPCPCLYSLPLPTPASSLRPPCSSSACSLGGHTHRNINNNKNNQQSTVNNQQSTINYQQSTINNQLISQIHQ